MRNGLGNILAEGTKKASVLIGKGSIRYAMQVKGLEMVPFEPRSQTNLALGYAVSPQKDKVFTLVKSGDSSIGYVANIDGTKTAQLFTTPLTQLNVEWPSENVIALDVRAGQSRIVAQGSLQEMSVREEICRVMEGGKEAFALRYRRINAGA